MSQDGLDPSMLQDFLTESSELIEQLDSDLVSLESAEADASQALLDGIFRSIHTIKGAASFLSLTTITTFAHAAEDALNRMRKGEISVTTEIMDILLRSTDILREMIDELGDDQPITDAPADLVEALHALVSGDAGEEEEAPQQEAAAEPVASQEELDPNAKPIELDATKMDLLSFMVTDLQDSLQQIDGCLEQLASEASRGDGAEHLAEIAEQIGKTAEFFHLDSLMTLTKALNEIAPSLSDVPSQLIDEILIRLRAASCLIEEQSEALDRKLELVWPLDTFLGRLNTLASGQALEDDVTGQHEDSIPALLELDGIIEPSASADEAADADTAPQAEVADAETATATTPPQPQASTPAADAPVKSGGEAKQQSHGAAKEQTIRVEVDRLEALLNMVGQLVLSKNRITGLTRRLGDHGLPAEVQEDFTTAASELERMTSELQIGVMRTRMQPLAKLFDRYPRVIRDMARITDKKIGLEVVGKDTEVDKSVLELLADPLVHMLRNCADHGIEKPEDRVAAGKPESGTVRLFAEHQGSHVRVELVDDGKGLDREVIGNKAIEKGLATADQVANLADEEVFRFIFAPGFSTAAQVSDLSGRGVGMDVVRTNIDKLNGTINVFSKKGQGTTIEILIPLTVAIMPAMMVGVGSHLYAVPLACITEIVKPEECGVYTVMGQQVMRLRDSVLPLIDLRGVLGETGNDDDGKFAVVVAIGSQHAGIIVDHLIGQQEIVIKPLDDKDTTGGPFSGATIREEGDVSLILDVIQLLRQTKPASRAAA